MTVGKAFIDQNPDWFERIETISPEEMAEAAVAGFFAVTKEWGIANEEARALLGSPSRSRFYRLKRGDPGSCHRLCNDELDRVAYITGIYSFLSLLYIPASHSEWLRNESNMPQDARYYPWGTGSPLGYMLAGRLPALADVYEFLSNQGNGL